MPKVTVRRGSEQVSYRADASHSLLDTLLSNGLEVNYSCKRGDCGQCIARVDSGAIIPIDRQKPCINGSSVYLCNGIATTDLQLRLPHWPQLADIKLKRSPAKIFAMERFAGDVVGVTLRLPPAAKFHFLAGQYIRVTNARQMTRSYSLAAPEHNDGMLRMHIRTVAGGGFSDYLTEEAKAGDLWQLEGPLGHFFLRDETVERTIFLATGTGVAPIYAILSSLTQATRSRLGSVHIYWGNRHLREAYLDTQMRELSHQWDLTYTSLASREPSPGSALHVQDQLASDLAEGGADVLRSAYVYGCGNPAMLAAAAEVCGALGLVSDNFVADSFTAS